MPVIGAAGTAGVVAIATLAFGANPRPFPSFGSGCTRADFRNAGTLVRAERCGPATGRRGVVVLYGCGGFDTFDHSLAVDLPRFRIATLYVDYFAPTPPARPGAFCSLWTDSKRLFPKWEATVIQAGQVLARRFTHVGVVGWSLGAGLAVASAERSRVFKAVAAFSAIAYPQVLAGANKLPPSVFLTGGSRDIVKPINADRLAAAAERAHVTTQLFDFGSGVHDWPGRQGETGRNVAAKFLVHHLA
jgi:dienelactone hydrolase